MEAKKGMSKQFGMTVRNGMRSGDVFAHYQKMVVLVDHAIDDPVYGAGVVGTNLYTGKEVVLFSNPVVSEGKAKSATAKYMKDWVKGLSLMGKKFTVGKDAVIFVDEVVVKNNMRTKNVTIDGQDINASVYFCQWIKCWRSTEAALAGGEGKDIMVGYGIGSISTRKTPVGGEANIVKINFFQPQGPENRFNEPGKDYQVVFSSHSLDDVLAIVEKECSSKMFTHFMTRIIDNESGKIVGQGKEISMYSSDESNSFAKTFAEKLAYGLNLTRSGLKQLISAQGYTFQFFGLHSWTVSFAGDTDANNPNKKTLTAELMENKAIFPRDDNGNIIARVAVPMAMRTSCDPNGNIWLAPVKVVGYTGIKKEANGDLFFAEDSEIIAADSYTGKPIFDAAGKQVERGIDRDSIAFEMEDQSGDVVYADSMFALANILGCQQLKYPENSQPRDYGVFLQIWDDTGEPFPQYAPRQQVQQPPVQQQPQPVRQVQQPVQQVQQPVQQQQQTVEQPVQQAQQPASAPRRARSVNQQVQQPVEQPMEQPQNPQAYPSPFGGSEDTDFDEVPF